jgi:hypothetical protein
MILPYNFGFEMEVWPVDAIRSSAWNACCSQDTQTSRQLQPEVVVRQEDRDGEQEKWSRQQEGRRTILHGPGQPEARLAGAMVGVARHYCNNGRLL